MPQNRPESPDDPYDPKRLTRNWNELLQELRVTQTGVQILTGFLLTVPFSDRFEDLDRFQLTLYLIVLSGSTATTLLAVAPAAFHRMLFRQRARHWLVEAANRCARASLVLMALTISGVLFLIFDVVAGDVPGVIAFVVSLLCFAALWVGTPVFSGHLGPPPDDVPPGEPAEPRQSP